MDKVRFSGRFDFSDPRGPWFAWSAGRISVRFAGTGIKVRLVSPGENTNYFTVFLDGKVISGSLAVNGDMTLSLAKGLSVGTHELALVKRTEFNIGKVQFLGFEVENGELLDPPEPSVRRMEIVGDSISCGFGVEGGPDTEYDPKYDNALSSYGLVTAELLGAECYDISCSGYGVIREYTGDPVNILPNVYSRILPGGNEVWDFKSWIPQIVVINLGTNDFSFGYIPDRAAFTEGYIRFVRRILGNYPQAHILCTIGPIIEGEVLEVTRECVKNGVVGWFDHSGQKNVHFLEFDPQKEEDGYGITNHPSALTHRKMAERLAAEIRTLLHWC